MSKKNTQSQSSKTKTPTPPTGTEAVGANGTPAIPGDGEPNRESGAGASKKNKKQKDALYGNQDVDQKHDLSKMNIPDGYVVVRHYNTVSLANGQTMEDPTTSRIQVYDPETFENLNSQKVKDGQQLPSQFETLGLNVEVLHDPS